MMTPDEISLCEQDTEFNQRFSDKEIREETERLHAVARPISVSDKIKESLKSVDDLKNIELKDILPQGFGININHTVDWGVDDMWRRVREVTDVPSLTIAIMCLTMFQIWLMMMMMASGFNKKITYMCAISGMVLLALTSILKHCQALAGEEVNSEMMESISPLQTYVDKMKDDLEGGTNSQGLSGTELSISAIIVGLISFVVGMKAKSSVLDGVLSALKVSHNQTSNMAMMLMTGSAALSSFFLNLNREDIAKFFDVSSFSSKEIAAYVEESSRFIVQLESRNTFSDSYVGEIYMDLLSQGEKLVKSVEKNSYDYRNLTKSLDKLRDANNRVMAIKDSLNGVRIEPVGVIIRGKPNCFKSVLLSRISNLVAGLTVPSEWRKDFEKNNKNYIYSSPNDQFFDGYTYKSWVTTIDDIFQKRDIAGMEASEAINIIKMINVEPFPLKMASVENKNKVFFRSPFVMATTNRLDFSSLLSVFDYKAVERRFNVVIDVELADKYTTLPDHKVNTEFGEISGSCIPNDAWKLKISYSSGGDKYSSKDVTLEDVVKVIVKAHRDRIINHLVNNSFNTSIYNKMRLDLENFSLDDVLTKITNEEYVHPQGLISSTFKSEEVELIPESRAVLIHEMENRINRSQPTREQLDLYWNIVSMFDLPYHYEWFYYIMRDVQMNSMSNLAGYLEAGTDIDRILDVFLRNMTLLKNSGISNITYTKPSVINYNTVKMRIEKTIKPIVKIFQDYKYHILGFGFLFAVSFKPLYDLVSSVFRDSGVFSQSVDYGRDRAKLGKPNKVSTLSNKQIAVKPQSFREFTGNIPKHPKINIDVLKGLSINTSVAASIMNKNMFIVYLVTPDKQDRMGHALNIRSNIFMMPFHFLLQMSSLQNSGKFDDGCIVKFCTISGAMAYQVFVKDLLLNATTTDECSERDVVFFKLEPAQRSSIGMFKFCLKENDLISISKKRSFPTTLVGTYQQESNIIVRVIDMNANMHNDLVVKSNWSGDEDPYYSLPTTVAYRNTFSNGDCGSFLLVEDTKFENRCVMGIHVAGSSDNGYATVITQEFIQNQLNKIFPRDKSLFNVDEDTPQENNCDIVSQGLMLPVSKVVGSDVPGNIQKSGLKRSALYGQLPMEYRLVTHVPSRIRTFEVDGVRLDPMERARQLYAIYSKPLDSSIIVNAVNSYESLISEHLNVNMLNRKVLSLEEILHSFGNVSSIASSTSPGYPMCLPKYSNLKKEYYNAVEEGDLEKISFARSRIAKVVNEKIDMFRKGVRPRFYYKDCLKDEIREKEKVLQGKTRMFSACDFILLILFRKYFGEFISAYFEANINVGSAIGVNPYSATWDDIARKLTQYNENKSDKTVGAGDFSKFDTMQCNQILWQIYLMIERWYGDKNDEDSLIRSQLFVEIVNSVHIEGPNVYEWFNGIPSGNPLTAIVNTIYNNIVFRMSFQHAGFDCSEFNKRVYMIALGDDNVFTSDKLVREFFNELTMPSYMDKCGMKYTNELKKESEVPARNIEEVSFLKRYFRFDDKLNRHVAPLSMDSIFATLNWTAKGSEADLITVDKIASSISELSLHGEEVFRKYAPTLYELKMKLIPHIKFHDDVCLNYDTVYNKVLDLEFNY